MIHKACYGQQGSLSRRLGQSINKILLPIPFQRPTCSSSGFSSHSCLMCQPNSRMAGQASRKAFRKVRRTSRSRFLRQGIEKLGFRPRQIKRISTNQTNPPALELLAGRRSPIQTLVALFQLCRTRIYAKTRGESALAIINKSTTKGKDLPSVKPRLEMVVSAQKGAT